MRVEGRKGGKGGKGERGKEGREGREGSQKSGEGYTMSMPISTKYNLRVKEIVR